MTHHYLYESDASDSYPLPSLETFYLDETDLLDEAGSTPGGERLTAGWYYWSCFPGCLPDSDPHGPFDSEDAALEDAREGLEEDLQEGGE